MASTASVLLQDLHCAELFSGVESVVNGFSLAPQWLEWQGNRIKTSASLSLSLSCLCMRLAVNEKTFLWIPLTAFNDICPLCLHGVAKDNMVDLRNLASFSFQEVPSHHLEPCWILGIPALKV